MASVSEIKKGIVFRKKLKEDPIKALEQLVKETGGGIRFDEAFFNKAIGEAIAKVIPEVVKELLITLIQSEEFAQAVVAEAVKVIRVPKDGDDGRTPKKGEDYFTEAEKRAFLKKATPKKGSDYFTENDVREIVDRARPIAGVDFKVPKGDKGDPGEDGTELSAEEIVKKINSLEIKPSKQIDAKHIKNLPKFMERVGTQLFRGGLKLIWNTKLDGTVNGTNTVFTVPAGKPDPKDDKFITSVRGVLKTSDAGDFVASNSNRTITFTTAPPNGSDSPRIILYHGK